MLVQKGCGISYWNGIFLRVMEGGGKERGGVSCRVFSEEVLILQDTVWWDKQVLALHYHGGIMPVLHL